MVTKVFIILELRYGKPIKYTINFTLLHFFSLFALEQGGFVLTLAIPQRPSACLYGEKSMALHKLKIRRLCQMNDTASSGVISDHGFLGFNGLAARCFVFEHELNE